MSMAADLSADKRRALRRERIAAMSTEERAALAEHATRVEEARRAAEDAKTAQAMREMLPLLRALRSSLLPAGAPARSLLADTDALIADIEAQR